MRYDEGAKHEPVGGAGRWPKVTTSTVGEALAATVSSTDGCSDIRTQADSQWLSFPPRYRWDGAVKDLHSRKPIEQDFMISARLNYLHIHFLLALTTARNLAELEPDLVSTAAMMLHVAVDAVVLKERLINSGTGLVWKVCCSTPLSRQQY